MKKGAWDPAAEQSFAPALANRIDRNTCGLVLAAKNAEALRILNDKIRDREIRKQYYCIVHGVMSPKNGRLDGYLERDLKHMTVRVRREKTADARSAATVYRTLETRDGLSLLECELLTGARTRSARSLRRPGTRCWATASMVQRAKPRLSPAVSGAPVPPRGVRLSDGRRRPRLFKREPALRRRSRIFARLSGGGKLRR